MLRKIVLPLIATLVLMTSAPAATAADSQKETAATSAASAWLQLVDDQKYPESWTEAAEYFRGAITEDDWVKAATGARTPLGKVSSRTVSSSSLKTGLPGVPDGEYVIVEFTTAFENKASSTETVTPMLEKDGEWRVSGYYIK